MKTIEMKGIYLGAFKAYHPKYNIVYQDINGKRDLSGDMMEIDLSTYDYVIATPPCNYYSRANYRRYVSDYSLKTKHLLPSILKKLSKIGKPYIVENVINYPLMKEFYDVDFVYQCGRHTYWTNVPFNPMNILQLKEFNYKVIKSGKNKGRIGDYTPSSKRQGGQNVHNVIEYWLQVVHAIYN
jgi:hypothetical protein